MRLFCRQMRSSVFVLYCTWCERLRGRDATIAGPSIEVGGERKREKKHNVTKQTTERDEPEQMEKKRGRKKRSFVMCLHVS
mmetsp:Transcript_21554/g.42811  ORF Transcript_21554/g.42811 Transcript_21554/m.42811 type:complete len:81 (+) Transcript_21554:1941-2183(+)